MFNFKLLNKEGDKEGSEKRISGYQIGPYSIKYDLEMYNKILFGLGHPITIFCAYVPTYYYLLGWKFLGTNFVEHVLIITGFICAAYCLY